MHLSFYDIFNEIRYIVTQKLKNSTQCNDNDHLMQYWKKARTSFPSYMEKKKGKHNQKLKQGNQ